LMAKCLELGRTDITTPPETYTPFRDQTFVGMYADVLPDARAKSRARADSSWCSQRSVCKDEGSLQQRLQKSFLNLQFTQAPHKNSAIYASFPLHSAVY
jgi:hypothetical protein